MLLMGSRRRRWLNQSTHASVAPFDGIEAPLRLYIAENPDGTATLSYKTAAHVLAPYAEEGGQTLTALAAELDTVLEQTAEQATSQRD
jgi:hypothetical protein